MTIERSESIKELAAALAKAQGQLRPAAKDAVNPHFKSKYADLGAVWEACREPLTANGLSVIQAPADAEPGRLALTTFLLHSSGEYLSTTYSMKLAQDTAHGAGSALTYLRRYALASLVGVVADEDDDGNSATVQPPQRQQVRPAAAQPRQSAPSPTNGHQNGASYEPPAEAKELTRHEKLIARIAQLTAEAEAADLEIELARPVSRMTDDELIEHGQWLRISIDQAKKSAMPEERFPDMENEYDAIDAAQR